jgi:carboxypeptidase T
MNKFILSLIIFLVALNLYASDYDTILKRMETYAKRPHITLFTLGKNDQGKDIIGMVVGDVTQAVRKHLVVGTHHGNERMAAELPFLFVDQIQKTQKLDTLYFVIPVLNISGYDRDRREETGSDGRTIDPNRDYEDACKTKVDFRLKSTELLSQFVEKEDIIAAVTIHGYVGSFTFPWGMHTSHYNTLDNAWLMEWAQKAAELNNYRVGTHGDIVYPADGAFEDWAYFKHGVWSYLLEIRSPSSDLNKDAAALVEFFKSAPSERSKHVGQKVNCLEKMLRLSHGVRP